MFLLGAPTFLRLRLLRELRLESDVKFVRERLLGPIHERQGLVLAPLHSLVEVISHLPHVVRLGLFGERAPVEEVVLLGLERALDVAGHGGEKPVLHAVGLERVPVVVRLAHELVRPSRLLHRLVNLRHERVQVRPVPLQAGVELSLAAELGGPVSRRAGSAPPKVVTHPPVHHVDDDHHRPLLTPFRMFVFPVLHLGVRRDERIEASNRGVDPRAGHHRQPVNLSAVLHELQVLLALRVRFEEVDEAERGAVR